MKFLTNVIGPPIPTDKPIRSGSYSILVSAKGFVVGDPEAFGIPGLAEESGSLPTGSGYINGHLHLHSPHFPMYYPGSSPRLILISRRLTVIPLSLLPVEMQSRLKKQIMCFQEFAAAKPEILLNVLPCFEIFQDSTSFATA